MTSVFDLLSDEDGLALSLGDYNRLCAVRDRLMMLAQFAGVESLDPNDGSFLMIRRMPLGHLFADLSVELRDVLERMTRDAQPAKPTQAH